MNNKRRTINKRPPPAFPLQTRFCPNFDLQVWLSISLLDSVPQLPEAFHVQFRTHLGAILPAISIDSDLIPDIHQVIQSCVQYFVELLPYLLQLIVPEKTKRRSVNIWGQVSLGFLWKLQCSPGFGVCSRETAAPHPLRSSAKGNRRSMLLLSVDTKSHQVIDTFLSGFIQTKDLDLDLWADLDLDLPDLPLDQVTCAGNSFSEHEECKELDLNSVRVVESPQGATRLRSTWIQIFLS